MKRQLHRHLKAMTLVEIMVVIAIIGLLAAVMVPTVKYQYRNRSVKEGERQLNAFIGAAQARAQQLGRPVGVWVERFNKDIPVPSLPVGANYSVQIYQAEVPRPYTGDLQDSRVTIKITPQHWVINFPSWSALQYENNPLIRRDDRFKIQFDHRGPFHEAHRLDTQGAPIYILLLNTLVTGGQITKAAFFPSSGVPYTIHRRPVRSFVSSLRLPQGAVIDLSVSGIEPGGTQFNHINNNATREPVIVMFHPDGSVGDVYFHGFPARPLGWIHLLVGRQDMVVPTNRFLETETEAANLMYSENRWVSINHRTGTVTSERLADINSAMKLLPNPGNLTFADKVGLSRELVRTGSGLEDD